MLPRSARNRQGHGALQGGCVLLRCRPVRCQVEGLQQSLGRDWGQRFAVFFRFGNGGFSGIYMGFNGILVGFNGISMGFDGSSWDLIIIECDSNGFNGMFIVRRGCFHHQTGDFSIHWNMDLG